MTPDRKSSASRKTLRDIATYSDIMEYFTLMQKRKSKEKI